MRIVGRVRRQWIRASGFGFLSAFGLRVSVLPFGGMKIALYGPLVGTQRH
jgi:hypothetical protein